jgi:hypothetical protein
MPSAPQAIVDAPSVHFRPSDLDEVAATYPDVPRLIVIKIDVQRRGVFYTDRALAAFDPAKHQARSHALFGSRDGQVTPKPEALLLRDGTSILADSTPLDGNPYTVDVVDGRLVLVDQGRVIETVQFWPRPAYYGKLTSSGIPMEHVVTARPQRLNVFPSSYCHFWSNDHGCKYCDIVNHHRQSVRELKVPPRLQAKDVAEVIREALKEPGRFTTICLTSGSDTRGEKPFDAEVDFYEEILSAITGVFGGRQFPSQLISSAFDVTQLRRSERANRADQLDRRLGGPRSSAVRLDLPGQRGMGRLRRLETAIDRRCRGVWPGPRRQRHRGRRGDGETLWLP